MANRIADRKSRRWWKVLAALAITLLLVIGALPWAFSRGAARRWLLARANKAMAPGGFDLTTLEFSWFGPTRMSGFVLRDPQGDRVIVAPRATWDRNLWQVLFDRPRYGTLRIDQARLDIERLPDGSVDLYEALRPIFRRNPKTDLRIEIVRGQLRFRSAGLPRPVLAEQADFTLEVPPAPRPLLWRLHLVQQAGRPGQSSFEIRGRYDRWRARPGLPSDLEIAVEGQRWPWSFAAARLESNGRFDGKLDFRRLAGRWNLSGQASIDGVDVTGPRLAGDRVRLDRAEGVWDLTQTADTWTIHRLDLTSPLASFKADGSLPTGGAARVLGTLDLAALVRQLPHALPLREGTTLDRGSALLSVAARTGTGPHAWDVEARLSDLVARNNTRTFTLREPATFLAKVVRQGNDLNIERLTVRSAFLNGTGQGDLDRGISWTAAIDLTGVQAQFHDLIDFGAVELAGKGELSGDYRRSGTSYTSNLAARLRDLKVKGVAPVTIQRDSVGLNLGWKGLADPSGLPRSWTDLKGGLASGEIRADLVASTHGGQTDAILNAEAPIALANRQRLARARLNGQWDGQAVAIAQLLVSLAPAKGAAGESIVWAARGRFDREAGELVLNSVPDGSKPNALALSAEGLRVSGIGQAGALRVRAGLVGDIAALSRTAGAVSGGWAGSWTALLTAQAEADGLHMGGKLDLPDLTWAGSKGSRQDLGGPVALSLKAIYQSATDQIDFSELVLVSHYANLEASGRLNDPLGRRQADLKGLLTPDWKVINRLLAERVEPGTHAAGKPRAWHLKGPLTVGPGQDWLKEIDGEIGVDLDEAQFFGMSIGPSPVVLRTRKGRLSFDPIDTSINEGRLSLDPEVTLDEKQGVTLRLGSGSGVEGARINDEVSHRVLSFVAPVLDRATRARGRVSLEIESAEFPIVGGADRGMKVDGSVVFQDVEFVPGPMVDQLFGLVGRDRQPSLKLNEPVSLTIADRRVYQHGFALPLGGLTRIELEGWVDFDRNLALTASLPLTRAMVGNNPLLGDIIGDARISVPIRGTLHKPEIDREAMHFGMKDLGKSLLDRGAARGAADLLMRLSRGRDPNAPPPPTAEERRARRQEKKAQRRRDRGLEP